MSSLAVSLGMSLTKKSIHVPPIAPQPPSLPPPEEVADEEVEEEAHESEQDFEQENYEETNNAVQQPVPYTEDQDDPVHDSQAEDEPAGGDEEDAEDVEEQQTNPDQGVSVSKKSSAAAHSRRPAAKKAKKALGEFTLKMTPRKGIALVPGKKSTAQIKILELLYTPPNHTIFQWEQVAAKGFVPAWTDVFRAWVRYTQSDKSTSDHFILLVKVALPEKASTNEQQFCYRWMSKETEMELLHCRELHNGVIFSGAGKSKGYVENLVRINQYNNRLPGSKRLKREGFVSDHVAQEFSPDHYNKPDCFRQKPALLNNELDLYMPTDILNSAELAEKQALDGLAEEEEQEEEEDAEQDNGAEEQPAPVAEKVHKSKKKSSTAPPATPKAKPKPRAKSVPASVVGTPVPLPTSIPGMQRRDLNAGLIASRDVPDLSSLNMADIVETITRNDYRIALAETGEPSATPIEPDLTAPPPPQQQPAPKKKAPSKPKGTTTVPTPTPKPKAAPAKAAPKRKATPVAEADEQPAKRVPVDPTAVAAKPVPSKKNGAKPKAAQHTTNPDQGVSKRVTNTSASPTGAPKLFDIPVTFPNLAIADGLLPQLAEPKLKKIAEQVQASREECASLLDEEYSLRDWFSALEKQLKEPDKHQTLINLVVVIIEAVCRNLKVNVVHFGSLDGLLPSKKAGAVNHLIACHDYVAAANFYAETRTVLLEHMDNQCNLIGFVEYCVVAEVHITEPMGTILKHALLKLGTPESARMEYRASIQKFIPMICAASQLIAEYFAREAEAGKNEEPEEEPEEEEVDLMSFIAF